MTRRFRRIAFTTAVLPLVVLVGLRSAWAAYACQIDGEVRSSCCCPKKAEEDQRHRPAGGAPSIEAASCCEVSVGEASAAPDVREADRLRSSDVPFVLIAAAPARAPVAHTRSPRPRAMLARPPPAVPIYLANRTILR